MAPWGDVFGRNGRRNLGIGVSVPPGSEPEPEDIIWDTFKLGLVATDSLEDLPEGGASVLTDIEVSFDDALVLAPGSELLEDVGPRSPYYIFEHAAVDYSTELVIIDPPYVGRKASDADFIFDNLAIAATSQFGWNICDIAGFLLFSNGLSATYMREPGTAIVTDISAEVVAQTLGTAFGRAFAGAYHDPISGIQGLGIKWNAASGDPDDWTGLGSGAQLLLSNAPEADRVVALRPIGFDVLAVLTRKAVWFGYPTQLSNAPADFRIRFPGNGCVAEATAVVTPEGIVYLSDNGVMLVDLNGRKNISSQIDSLLLPLDYLALTHYRAVYDGSRQRYILQTPQGVFVYSFARLNESGQILTPGRWYFRSVVPDSLVMFTDQSQSVYWDTILTHWNTETLTWAETVVGEQNVQPELFYTRGTKIERSAALASTYNGTAMTPVFASSQKNPRITDEIVTLGMGIEFKTTEVSSVQFLVPDSSGTFAFAATVALPDTGGEFASGYFPFSGSGKGARLQYKIISGDPQLYRIRQVVMPAGPATTSLVVT